MQMRGRDDRWTNLDDIVLGVLEGSGVLEVLEGS
jgi:hypothetical protein